MHVYNSSRPT